MIELLNIDCMEYMAGLPDKVFDLAIVDPPYGIGIMDRENLSRGKKAKAKNYKLISDIKPTNQYYKELFRVSKNQIIWGANHFISDIPFNSSCWIVWDKNNNTNDFADCELAWTSFKTAVRKFKFTWNGMIQEDMKNKEHRIHICQKPVKLYSWILTHYAIGGGKILDTHLGSGSSAIAAHRMGFDFVGTEIDKDYYDAACKRFKEQTAQTQLFN